MDLNIIDLLIKLVMSERQAKLYHAILKNNNSTAAELHRLSGLPKNKTYETIDFLTLNGFCTKKSSGKKVTYYAIDPLITIQQIMDQKHQEITELNDLMLNLKSVYDSEPPKNDFSEYIEVIYGNVNIHKKFIELINNSSKQILSIGGSPYTKLTKKQNLEQWEASENFEKKGGITKTIYELNPEIPPFVFYFVRTTLEDNLLENNRVIDESPMKLAIFDNNTLLTIDKSSKSAGNEICATVVKQPVAVKTYINIFNSLFKDGVTLERWSSENKELLDQKIKEFDLLK